MKSIRTFIQRWWRTAFVILLLIGFSWSVPFWLQPALAFVGVQGDLLQGLDSAVNLIAALLAIGYVLYNFTHSKPAETNPTTQVFVADRETVDELLGKRLSQSDLDAGSKEYVRVLVDRFRYLDTRGMGVTDRLPLRLELLDLYVPLKARIEMPEGETWARQLKVAGRMMSESEIEGIGTRLSEPQPLAQLLRNQPGLIILGDPGAGKSTFMKFLALTAALNRDEDLGLRAHIPFLLPLSAYANALAHKDTPLDQCIADHWRGFSDDLPVLPILKQALQQGKALLLLDGLDEIRDATLRKRVVDHMSIFFLQHKAKGNKFVFTSRIVGYKEVRPTADGLSECTIVDFEQAEIERFAAQWTGAVARAAHDTAAIKTWDAERERTALLEAVERNPGVRQLAANPLLLTILALMKRQGITLPERRAELYQTYVLTLLKHWNLARGWGRPPTRDLDEKETLKLLAPLALWMHEVSPGVGLVEEEDVKRKLLALCRQRGLPDPEATCTQFLADVHDHSALLLERGQRQYGFIHLTFQEYLAGMAVAQQGQMDHTLVVQQLAAHIDDPNWHEVSLLAIGYLGLVQQNDEVASAVLDDLLHQAPGEPGQAVILAGECAADVGPGITPACRQKVIDQLTATLTQKPVTAVRRVAAGRILGQRSMGDPRHEVTTLEGMQFCLVPAGPFLLGSAEDDEQAYADEKPQHEYNIDYPYWINRFPISNAQYERFIQADGYANPVYWGEAQQHELWQDGKVRDVWYTLNDKKDDLVRNVGGWRQRPVRYEEPFSFPNHPVVGVNWYEVLAFSRWLQDEMQMQGWLPNGWQVQLPNEPEWEKAARGGLQSPRRPLVRIVSKLQIPENATTVENKQKARRYPWGGNLEFERTNCKETKIATTSTPGCFPSGRSPYGVEEMVGNTWEWTRSLWGIDRWQPTYMHPYQSADGREQLNASVDVRRVIRGGAYNNGRSAGCSVRRRKLPDNRSDDVGFRVVLTLLISSRDSP